MTLALCLVVAGKADAQQIKIGYISSQELVSIMPETKKADTNLMEYRNALIQSATENKCFLRSYRKIQPGFSKIHRSAEAGKEG